MKKLFLLTCILFLALFAQAQQVTVNTTAGNLRARLIAAVGGDDNLITIRDLKINGTLNAQDFADARSGSGSARIQQTLVSLDLSGVTAVENKEIPKQAFYQFTALERVTFPSGGVITTIGESAFNDCFGLTALTLPEGITTVMANGFRQGIGSKLTTLKLPSTLKTIGNGAFYQAVSLEQLTLPEGLEYIDDHAFYSLNNIKMTEITIPASVEYIGAQAFALATYNEKITFAPRNGKPIEISGDRTFRSSGILSDNGLTIFEFPDNTTISFREKGDGILSGFFSAADKLKEVRNLPAGITQITAAAFQNTAIENFVVPEGVTTIGINAFNNNPHLKTVTLPASVTSIGNFAFSNNTAMTSIVTGENITSIGNGAFQNTSTLTSISLGNKLESIGNNAFNGASVIEMLELPETVTSIGEGAFQNMTGLKFLVVHNPVPIIFSTQRSVFEGINRETAILYVPSGKVQDYKDFDLWNTFANIKEIGSDENEQTIEGFTDITATVGTNVVLSAAASSGLPLTYTIEDETIATLNGSTLTLLKEGTTTIKALQPGDGINHGKVEKTVTLMVISLDWLEEVTILISGNSAKIVGPAETIATFTKFYINDKEAELANGSVDLSESTGKLSLKATNEDGSEVIRISIEK